MRTRKPDKKRIKNMGLNESVPMYSTRKTSTREKLLGWPGGGGGERDLNLKDGVLLMEPCFISKP